MLLCCVCVCCTAAAPCLRRVANIYFTLVAALSLTDYSPVRCALQCAARRVVVVAVLPQHHQQQQQQCHTWLWTHRQACLQQEEGLASQLLRWRQAVVSTRC